MAPIEPEIRRARVGLERLKQAARLFTNLESAANVDELKAAALHYSSTIQNIVAKDLPNDDAEG